jgi:hypothetical protein
MSEVFDFEGTEQPEAINYIAFVLDGRVEMTLGTDPRFASILLSEPKILSFNPAEQVINIGHIYDETTNTFYSPSTPDDASQISVEPNV